MEELAGLVLVLALVLGAIALCLFLAVFLIQVLVVVLPTCLVASMFAYAAARAAYQLRRADTALADPSFLEARWDGGTLTWVLDANSAALKSLETQTVLAAVAGYAVAFAVGLSIEVGSGFLSGLDFFDSAAPVELCVVVAIVVAVALAVVAAKKLRQSGAIRDWVSREAPSGPLKSIHLVDDTRGLEAQQAAVAGLCAKLTLEMPTAWRTDVQAFVAAQKEKLVGNPGLLTAYLRGAREEGDSRHRELERLAGKFADLRIRLDAAQGHALDLGSQTLIDHVGDIRQALESSNIRSLITDSRWSDCDQVLDMMAQDIDKIIAVRRSGMRVADDPEVEDEAWAYRVLNVSPSESSDRIHSVFKRLSLVWHPDQGGLNEGMSRANRAWAIIKKARGL